MSGYRLILQRYQLIQAQLKVQGMKPATLNMVVQAINDLSRFGWFDPLEEYAPYVTMEEWRQVVLGEYHLRQAGKSDKGRVNEQ